MMLGGAFPPWDADEDKALDVLWRAGFSAGDIAARLPGRSRNAVMGRAFRLGLPRRPSPIPQRTKSQALETIASAVEPASPANRGACVRHQQG